MSAFDRMQNYSAKRGLNETSSVFDCTKPEGAFLNRVHQEGYKLYKEVYTLKDEFRLDDLALNELSDNDLAEYEDSISISVERYNTLEDILKARYEKSIEFTELHNVLKTYGNQEINAIAGSGKTTALIFKIMYDIVTGEAVTLKSINDGTPVRVVNNMWVCTFLRSGAEELESALTARQRQLGYSITSNQISFSTMDAEFKRCLNAMGVATPIGDASKLHSLLVKAVDSCNITRNGYPLTKEDYNIISGIITYYRGRLDQKRYQHPSAKDYDLTPTILDLVVRQFADLRHTNGIMDFEEVMELLYKYLYVTPNPAVQDFVANRYNYIYVDEFQDTSQMAYAILKFYARGHLWLNCSGEPSDDTSGLYTGAETKGKIVVIGDPSQCLLEGTTIETTYGTKNIEDVTYGDTIRVASGWGSSSFMPVDDLVVSDYNGSIMNIELESGKKISCTPEHKMFTRVVPNDSVFYVYLMYKHGFGFRIGQTHGVRTKDITNGYEIRLRQEGADRIWLLEQCYTQEDATFFENLYSYKYGIPQYVFDSRNNDTIMTISKIHKLHEELNTLEKGKALLRSRHLDFDLPIYSATASLNRSTLIYNMFGVNQHRHSGMYPSCISSNYTECNDNTEEIIARYLSSRTKTATKTGRPYKLYDYTTDNLDSIEELIRSIKNDVDDNDLFINIIRNAKLTDNYFSVVPASQLFKGFKLCIIDDNGNIIEDTVKNITYSYYSGKVYDINISGARNFSANGIIVHNCIYSFRGSDSSILVTEFDKDFKPCIDVLSVNWRCPANILNPVVPSIHKNWDSAFQVITPAREGGEFIPYAFTSYKGMISQLKDDISKDMEENMKVAVLCRTNFDGLIPAFMLEADGRFDFSISGENMTMSSPLPRKIIGATALFTERSTPAVKNALAFFNGRGGDWQLKQLIDTLKMNNMSIWQIPIEDIKYSCPNLVEFVNSVKPVFHDANGKRNKDNELEALRVVYYKMITETFAGDSAYCESARAYIETLLYIIENNDFKSVYDFIEEVELINDKLNGRIKKKKAPIQIATVHEYKGKECDSVYVWNDSDGTFPSSKCDVENEEQLNEERRVHYIACTRAKKREHIYTMANRMGIFAAELDAHYTNPVVPKATLGK